MADPTLTQKRTRRGAIALEYLLIVALVSIALIAAFRSWGQATAKAVKNVAVSSQGALQPP